MRKGEERGVRTRSQLALLRAPFLSAADLRAAAAGIAKSINAQYTEFYSRVWQGQRATECIYELF